MAESASTWTRLAAAAYAKGRGVARRILNQSPWLDRWIGDRLRRLEGRLPTQALVDSLATNPITCHGLVFHYGPGERHLVTTMVFYGDYEPETRGAIEEILAPGATFVDLGAHVGYYTLLAARAVGPSGRVYAFEPNPTPRAFLERNVEENGLSERVRIVAAAAYDAPGRLEFTADPDFSEGGHLGRVGAAAARSFEVEATSVDAFLETEGWPRVDLVKMDIEGAEMAALRGMAATIRKNPRMHVIFELNLNTLRESSTRPEDLLDFLTAAGLGRFRVLYRHTDDFVLPRDLSRLSDLVRRANVNVLASPTS